MCSKNCDLDIQFVLKLKDWLNIEIPLKLQDWLNIEIPLKLKDWLKIEIPQKWGFFKINDDDVTYTFV